jgi:hypothetical protein
MAVTRADYYVGVAILSVALLAGDYGIHRLDAQAAAAGTMRARQFELVDADGRVTGALKTSADGQPEIVLSDRADRAAAALGPGSLELVNLRSHQDATVSAVGKPYVQLDGSGGGSVSMNIGDDGQPDVIMASTSGAGVLVNAGTREPYVGLTAADGTTAVMDSRTTHHTHPHGDALAAMGCSLRERRDDAGL